MTTAVRYKVVLYRSEEGVAVHGRLDSDAVLTGALLAGVLEQDVAGVLALHRWHCSRSVLLTVV